MDHFYGIYGVGAVIIILFSSYFCQNNYTLYLGGYIVGSTTEYVTSFFVEVILHTRWWDYSHNVLNINGRVCLLYSTFWGILTIFLVKIFNPFLDKIISKVKNKLPSRINKMILIFMILFLLFDCLITGYAQDIFITRMVIENHIEIKDLERRKVNYKILAENKALTNFINTYWNNEKMIKTFPNMKIEDIYSNIIYLDSLCPDVQPYYKKLFEKNINKQAMK